MKMQLNSVSKIIKKALVIDSVSMTLSSGSVTGLQGVNGSGKTMLMRLISGLIKPSSGLINIEGKILGRDIDFPQSLGALIEAPAFLENYSAYDNLKLIASINNKILDSEIKATLKKVGLDPDSKKKYKKFSLGMKQRLGIACAIMELPDILLLDEPTNALDSSGIEMIKNIVAEFRERGAIVVITCHDANILTALVDEIFVLDGGKIIDKIKIDGTI